MKVVKPIVHRPDWEKVIEDILEYEIQAILDCIKFIRPSMPGII